MKFEPNEIDKYKYHNGQMSCSKNCGRSCPNIICVNFYNLLLMRIAAPRSAAILTARLTFGHYDIYICQFQIWFKFHLLLCYMVIMIFVFIIIIIIFRFPFL